MLSRLRTNTSPAALVIALIALFVAIGGVAGALPGKNTVNSGDVKKNSLKGVDINESTLDIPSTAVAKDTFGATVDLSGNIQRATLPGTTSQLSGGNLYLVTFPRSVQSCVPVASGTVGLQGSAVASLSSTKPNSVDVATQAGGPNPAPFHLIVNC